MLKLKPVSYLFRRHVSRLPNLDFEFLCEPKNLEETKWRIRRRKESADVDLVVDLYKSFDSLSTEQVGQLKKESLKIPNFSHPDVPPDEPKVVRTIGQVRKMDFKAKIFEDLASKLGLIRMDTSVYSGPRSYFLIDHLARLEHSLVRFSVSRLLKMGFNLISVPDILPKDVIDACGMNTEGERTQVYQLGDDLCLSGTAEMGIAAYLQNKTFRKDELPAKYVAVSRCFRAETSKISEERGLYRVHQFTKVEMFGVSERGKSSDLLEEFRDYEEKTFRDLGLALRTLDMPECELGAQAYRKYDVEAFLPGKNRWGEISSASDCTDFQSRRLNIRCDRNFAHTVNGTACAVPRMIIAILETHQNKNGSVDIPEPLVPFFGSSAINKSSIPLIKQTKIK